MTRVHFLCPDLTHPSGGVRVMYRHVDLLNAAGLADARIVHHKQGFKAPCFGHDTPGGVSAV